MANNKCPECGAPVTPGSFYCTNCGAPLAQSGSAVQTAEEESGRVQTPTTIDELLAFCERHELPLAKMRFFIGLDYPGERAFGIYRDGDEFVVYKNKADGSRAVRYRGPDEAYAVNEIFQKLKEEATHQRSRVAAARRPGYTQSEANARNPYNEAESERGTRRSSGRSNALLIFLITIAAAVTIGRTAAAIRKKPAAAPSSGYYHYNDQYYYNQGSSWYLYNSFDGWYPIYSVEDELLDNWGDYYSSYTYDTDYGVDSFADSGYYDADYSYSGDWDESGSDSSWSWEWNWDDDDDWDSSDDWDWDSDWDSDWTDWDSDW